ncbi:MAG: transglycosylase SLT domain-containing protein [Muribaculaceae bacterium]|nr:transglycosylase SLT domain-containing protein [Muribaculaceae bacterium]
MNKVWLLSLVALCCVTEIFYSSCSSGKTAELDYSLPDTLRVATLYSPLSYFSYRDEEMGYDYSLIKQFASDKGLVLDLKVAPSMARMVEMLDSGEVDILAYEIPVTAEYQSVLPAGPESMTTQVLVQPRKNRDSLITDVTQLVGRDVYVEKNSKYQYRLENLNEELGGGINIHTVDIDTLITEDLIGMVAGGKIPLTIVDSDIARINKTYYPDLDINLELSFPQRQAWGVSDKKPWLADSINVWFQSDKTRHTDADLLKKYFEQSKNDAAPIPYKFKDGKISPYDDLFKKYAKEIGWDWRLLAAQGYTESHFNPNARSWAGARGIMQLMPGTARQYGLSSAKITNPEANIATAVKLIRDLDKVLTDKIPDPEERKKFIIASYNSGHAHIYDAIALARKTGKDPQKWDGNVQQALMLKSNPKYFNDPDVKYGYFRGRQTSAYVREVYKFYEQAKKAVPA